VFQLFESIFTVINHGQHNLPLGCAFKLSWSAISGMYRLDSHSIFSLVIEVSKSRVLRIKWFRICRRAQRYMSVIYPFTRAKNKYTNYSPKLEKSKE
jgi:hypothetical protein